MDKTNASHEPSSSSPASSELHKSLLFSHSTGPFLTADETFQPVEPVVRSSLRPGGYKWRYKQPRSSEALPEVPEFTREQLREYAADRSRTASSFEFTRSDDTFSPTPLHHSSALLLPAAPIGSSRLSAAHMPTTSPSESPATSAGVLSPLDSPCLSTSVLSSAATSPSLSRSQSDLDSPTEALAGLNIGAFNDNWHVGHDAPSPLPYTQQPMPLPPTPNLLPTSYHPMTEPTASVDSASSVPARDRVRAPRMTLDDRCCAALDTIAVRRRGGIETLLSHVFGPEASEQTRKHAERFYSDPDKMSAVLDCWYESPEGREGMQSWMKKHAIDYVKDLVDEEMTTTAAKFQLKLADATPDRLLDFRVDTHVYDVLASKAPVILSLLKRAMQSDRAAHENTLKCPDTMAAVIAAMMAKHRSQNAQLFACPAGLSLWAAGAPRQVIDILSQLGFSTEYSSIRNARAAVSKHAMELASQAARKRHLLGYDNIQISTSTFVEQRDDAPAKMICGTTIILYPLRDASDEACLLAPIIARRNALQEITLRKHIAPSPDTLASIDEHMSLHITETLLQFCAMLPAARTAYHASPVLKHREVRPPPKGHKTEQFPMETVPIAENSTTGNIRIIDDIYLRQAKMDDAGDLSKYAIPCINDQSTNSNIRSAHTHRREDETPFLRLDSLQLGPGMFHALLNSSWMILDVHRGDAADPGSLESFITLLNKKRHGSEHPDYHAIKATLFQVLDGLLLHAWELECGFPSLDDFMASNPTPQTLHDIGYRILQKYARAPRPSDPDDIDGVLHNTRLLLRDLLLFRTLHEGVKSGDFGRPEELFGIFTLFFCGAGARNYCAEFLHFLQNIHMVWTPDFANVMRDNMLINMSGRDGHWTGVDENIEHTIKQLQLVL
ncbi:hypothetical protein FA95DRAFT_1612171 [Auriscalpium vulgare]|uniref:Uncharacterized protein n=1 Tax=Auriscalpium vulgare TaxID=40419 RepID=A0ACB8R8N8_9AGAM|nr:hypothetical protein FA95DRAFT_1612171 [Auriscalpium vulgare]